MKFPSIEIIKDNVVSIFKRFPLEVIFTVIGTVAFINLIQREFNESIFNSYLQRISYSALIGFLLSLCNTLYCERKLIAGRNKIVYQAGVVLFAVLFFFMLNPFSRPADHPRFFLICLSLHLAVSFSGFLVADNINGFWQFNKTIFLRFLTGAQYSLVLFLGISAAMGAMDYLFHVTFYSRDYGTLWVLLFGIFNTLFFLGGVPEDLASLNDETDYPRGLKVFTQYVLIPLASIYLVILLAYEFKILLNGVLPKGLVSNLILGYAVFGILSLLLVYPVRNQNENRWIKQFSKSFYMLMIPLLVLLFLALWKRISSYGFTEYRYFLMLLAFWLLFITVYFLWNKWQNIKMIPISLSLLALFSVYGPQSAFSVAERSQRNILLNVFNRNHLVVAGKIQPATNSLMSKKDKTDAYDKVEYLINNYGIESLQPLFAMNLRVVKDSVILANRSKNENGNRNRYTERINQVTWCSNYLGVSKVYEYDSESEGVSSDQIYKFKAESRSLMDVSGYSLFFEDNGNVGSTFTYSNNGVVIKKYIENTGKGYLNVNNEFVGIDLTGLINTLIVKADSMRVKKNKYVVDFTYFLPQDILTISSLSKRYSLKMIVNEINYGVDEKKHFKKLMELKGYYFIISR